MERHYGDFAILEEHRFMEMYVSMQEMGVKILDTDLPNGEVEIRIASYQAWVPAEVAEIVVEIATDVVRKGGAKDDFEMEVSNFLQECDLLGGEED